MAGSSTKKQLLLTDICKTIRTSKTPTASADPYTNFKESVTVVDDFHGTSYLIPVLVPWIEKDRFKQKAGRDAVWDNDNRTWKVRLASINKVKEYWLPENELFMLRLFKEQIEKK